MRAKNLDYLSCHRVSIEIYFVLWWWYMVWFSFWNGVKGMIQAARAVVRSTWGKPDLPGSALVFLLGDNHSDDIWPSQVLLKTDFLTFQSIVCTSCTCSRHASQRHKRPKYGKIFSNNRFRFCSAGGRKPGVWGFGAGKLSGHIQVTWFLIVLYLFCLTRQIKSQDK